MPAPPQGLRLTCPRCGAANSYAPGTSSLRCASCGNEIVLHPTGAVVEHRYDDTRVEPVAGIGPQSLTCPGCGAATKTDLLASLCPFCATPLIAHPLTPGLHVPDAVVPFGIDKAAANDSFLAWVRSRRFAPRALRQIGSSESIQPTFVPHWTFDASTTTEYDGRRGDHYYVTLTRQVSDGRGGTTTETYTEQRTRWSYANGRVAREFDDVLVAASTTSSEHLAKAGPWPLTEARPFEPAFLAGTVCPRYDVDPPVALVAAQRQMESTIGDDCRADIGGDEQQVSRMDVDYRALLFKLVLLPLWIATYVYAGDTFDIVVNANTGEVVGERPYSKVKIALAVVAGLLVVAAIVVFLVLRRR